MFGAYGVENEVVGGGVSEGFLRDCEVKCADRVWWFGERGDGLLVDAKS